MAPLSILSRKCARLCRINTDDERHTTVSFCRLTHASVDESRRSGGQTSSQLWRNF